MNALSELRETLREHAYWWLCGGEQLTRRLVAGDPEAPLDVWRAARGASATTKALLLLFFFGRAVSTSAFPLSPRLSKRLLERGLLREAGSTFESTVMLVPVAAGYLFGPHLLSHRSTPPGLYLGRDSFRLADQAALLQSPGRWLELGPGTGLARLASRKNEYCGVEIDPFVLEVARSNFELNGLTSRSLLRLGDFFQEQLDPPYGLVLANPPYLPCPPEQRLPALAHGGADGLDLVRRLIADYQQGRFGPSCELLMVLTYFSNAGSLGVEKLIDSLYDRFSVSIGVLSLRKVTPQDMGDLALAVRGEHDATVTRSFTDHYNRLGFTHQFDLILHFTADRNPRLRRWAVDGKLRDSDVLSREVHP